MTLREYIDEIGYDYERFFLIELSVLVVDGSGIVPRNHYQSYLDYDILEVEYHIQLERGGSADNDDESSSYHIITLYDREES